MNGRELFIKNLHEYFSCDYCDLLIKEIDKPQTHGFCLNLKKGKSENILKMVDFDFVQVSENSFKHECNNIGKTKAYELGLIYPQGNEASLPTTLPDLTDVKVVVDMCAAPGGKSINIQNRLSDDVLLISNEYTYSRVNALATNIERMGYTNTVITSKDTSFLANELIGCVDLVILDVPCSGEGMVRKYPEMFTNYSNENIDSLVKLQESLLENAYRLLKPNGQLLYSTCTFSLKEDEYQIENFLNRHNDMNRISEYNKKTFVDKMEGQFYVLLKKGESGDINQLKFKKVDKNNIVEKFINENLDIDEYYTYRINDNYYLSTIKMPEFKHGVIRYGVNLGTIVKDRFEPEHGIFRANNLKFKNNYELNDEEYIKFISGNEIPVIFKDCFVRLTYQGFPIGFGKVSKNRLKNRYPKGLRRMI